MVSLKKANQLLTEVKRLVDGKQVADIDKTDLRVGLDLGTSSIVFVVVDRHKRPVFAASEEAVVVRDGLVVDYVGALQISRRLKDLAEETLQTTLTRAAGAIPPGTVGNSKNVIKNIIEGIGMECEAIIDEPTAAAAVLEITDGAVVDVGGGTTGISIIKDGQVVFSGDEPTGGTQMTLVVSGYFKISHEEGEKIKRNKRREAEIFSILRPVVDKMATICKTFIAEYGQPVPVVYLVGGSTKFKETEAVFEGILQTKIVKPLYPEFVTPLGIALSLD